MASFFKVLKSNQAFVWLAAAVLIVSSVTGYLFHDTVKPVVKEALKQLEEVVRNVQENPTYANTFFMIFWNNVRATFLMMLSGYLFGLLPFLALLSNGFMLGYVLYEVSDLRDVHPLVLFVQQILPHGILELPAMIIAAGFGLKLGWLALRGIGALLGGSRKKGIGREFRESFRQFATVFAGVVVLLFFAAAIEAGLIVVFG